MTENVTFKIRRIYAKEVAYLKLQQLWHCMVLFKVDYF